MPNTHLTTFKQSEERRCALLSSLRANPAFPKELVPTQPQPPQLWALSKPHSAATFALASLQYAVPHRHKPRHLPRFLPRSANIYSVNLDWSAFICSEAFSVCPLPLHMVQVSQHAQASNGVELAVVYQAAVSAAGHRHPWNQVPVVQQGHVAPHVSHHHPWVCAPCKGSAFLDICKWIFTCCYPLHSQILSKQNNSLCRHSLDGPHV